MQSEFSAGDVVRLKSGGPDMTVRKIGSNDGEPLVIVDWFEGTQSKNGAYPPSSLENATKRVVGVSNTRPRGRGGNWMQ